MLELGGNKYEAQCLGCSDGKTIWARYDGKWWKSITVEQIIESVLADSDNIMTVNPQNFRAAVKEKIGKLGGVFCPTCMEK